MNYICNFCHSECASLSAHWERCDGYRRFMAGSVYRRPRRWECATPGCTGQRVERRRKCAVCIARELNYQKKQTSTNGWRRK